MNKKKGKRIAIAPVVVMLWALCYFSFLSYYSIAAETTEARTRHRIAILIPFISNSQPILPTYFPLFIQSVQGLSPLIDFLIFHNGQLTPLIQQCESNDDINTSNISRGKIMDLDIPDNVQFIDLHNTTYFGKYLLKIMDIKRYNLTDNAQAKLSSQEYDLIYFNYGPFLAENPYALIEVKPALGYIFREYIPQNKYTHWGYSDLDVYFGDLQSWITKDELTNYDIVTYGFGDQHRVYLRGQFTFHKNDVQEDKVTNPKTKEIYKIWSQCHYLYDFDVRFMKLLLQRKFHLQSAEGCYSSVIISSSKHLRVKYAVKAWTNPKSDEGMDTYGVSAIFMNSNADVLRHRHHQAKQRSILIKKTNAASGSDYLQMISDINSNSIFNSTALLPTPMQWEIDDIQLVTTKEDLHCMSWAPKEYQHNLCIDPKYNIGSHHTVYLINGRLFKRRFEERNDLFFISKNNEVAEDEEKLSYPIVETRPIFHLQEWKRSYRSTQLSAMRIPKKDIIGWTFYPEGVIPIFDKLTKADRQIVSNKKNYLPSQYHCLMFKTEKQKGRQLKDDCQWSTSWYDSDVVKIEGPNWEGDSKRDVDQTDDIITLALTLRIPFLPNQHVSDEELDSILEVIEANILQWNNQPWTLFVCVVGNDGQSTSAKIITKLKQSIASVGSTKYLIGVLTQEKHIIKYGDGNTIQVNRKALLNLAESASYTRWTISGMDIENRRSIVSKDSVKFAEIAASTMSESGLIFVIPDFYSVQNLSSNPARKSLSLADLYYYISKGEIKPTSLDNGDNYNGLVSDIQEDFYSLWFSYSKQIESSSDAMTESRAIDFAKRLDKIYLALNQLILNDKMNEMKQTSNVLLMVDKYSPNHAMCTQFVATEIDELGSCYNVMRLVQFSLLEYQIRPLPGVFTSSVHPRVSTDICKSAEDILKEERQRIAKLMIMQR